MSTKLNHVAYDPNTRTLSIDGTVIKELIDFTMRIDWGTDVIRDFPYEAFPPPMPKYKEVTITFITDDVVYEVK